MVGDILELLLASSLPKASCEGRTLTESQDGRVLKDIIYTNPSANVDTPRSSFPKSSTPSPNPAHAKMWAERPFPGQEVPSGMCAHLCSSSR